MMYLPGKLNIYYSILASKLNLDQGEVMYFVLRKYALDHGFECDHPLSMQVIHKKGKPSLEVATIHRCADCGMLYYKDKFGEMKPRIESLE
jgi:hypothetical protein